MASLNTPFWHLILVRRFCALNETSASLTPAFCGEPLRRRLVAIGSVHNRSRLFVAKTYKRRHSSKNKTGAGSHQKKRNITNRRSGSPASGGSGSFSPPTKGGHFRVL